MKLHNLTEARTIQRTEYRVSPLDEYGDIIDIEFFSSKKEALKAASKLKKTYPQAVDWLFEKNVRKFASDGNLLDDDYIDLGEY